MSEKPTLLSTGDVVNSIGDPNVQIIDIRSVDAYNGWRLNHEKRGGHIRSARSLPFKWINYIDWLDIVDSKDIYPNQSIIIYGDQKSEIDEVAEHFMRAGFENVRVYYNFIEDWCNNTNLPMSHLKRYRHLVPASWVHDLMLKGNVPEYDNDKFIICHAHYRNRADYEEGHIPGAIDLDTNLLESSDTWNRRSPSELKEALEACGITHDTTVILYGRFSFPDNSDPFPGSSAGHLGAHRCAFIMMYAGVKDVRIINGGLQSWFDEGFKITKKEVEKQPVETFGCKIPNHPEFAVDLEEAKQILASEDGNLVSVRSWREFIGEVSGYNYIEKKGRIPGAVFGNCGSDAYHMENYRNLDHTAREYHEIIDLWAEAGIAPDQRNAFYCGTGWRGSEAFFNAWLMGWPRVAVYDGGWFEWSRDDSNPIETGIPE